MKQNILESCLSVPNQCIFEVWYNLNEDNEAFISDAVFLDINKYNRVDSNYSRQFMLYYAYHLDKIFFNFPNKIDEAIRNLLLVDDIYNVYFVASFSVYADLYARTVLPSTIPPHSYLYYFQNDKRCVKIYFSQNRFIETSVSFNAFDNVLNLNEIFYETFSELDIVDYLNKNAKKLCDVLERV